MSWHIFSGMKPNKESFSFLLTLICIIGLFLMAFFKGTDILNILAAIHATYITARSVEKVSAHRAAAKDSKCDTRRLINDLEGNTIPDNPDK
jgi:uncharacterized membrane protein